MKIQAEKSILKINNPTTKQFLEMWREYQPFLIGDVAEHWNAYKNWSNDYLIEHCGNNMIYVNFYKKDFLDDHKNFASEDTYNFGKEMTYQEYIENLVHNEKRDDDLGYYLTQAYLEVFFPEIVEDVIYPKYFNKKPLVSLWHGFSTKNSSSTTTLHFDGYHNIFAQIRGRKRILLFPPSNYLSFYPSLEERLGLADFSKVDPNLPNLELFPNFPWQERIEFVLQPGEILYIPPYWWHYVTAVDENISLSFFYNTRIQDFFQQKNMLPTFLNIVPHYLYHAISSPDGLKNSLGIIKSLILKDNKKS